MLHIIQREMEWRKKHGKPEGFNVLRARKPTIAVGAEHPLDDQRMLADYFRKSQFRRLRCALWTAGANCRKMAWTDWEAFIAR